MSYYLRTLNSGFNVGFHSFRDFDRLLDRVFDDVGYSSARHFSIEENEDSYLLSLDLPGVKQGDVDVTLDKSVLTVASKRGEHQHSQSVTIPEDVDADKIEARLEHGVLTVVLGKQAVAKPRKIAIR